MSSDAVSGLDMWKSSLGLLVVLKEQPLMHNDLREAIKIERSGNHPDNGKKGL